jgi:hypothetical protein
LKHRNQDDATRGDEREKVAGGAADGAWRRFPRITHGARTRSKREGKARFVGFTGHKNSEIHLAMPATGYAFDTLQMPLR